MRKLVMMLVAATFSVSAAAYACDGMKQSKAEKSSQTTAKKDSPAKDDATKSEKRS